MSDHLCLSLAAGDGREEEQLTEEGAAARKAEIWGTCSMPLEQREEAPKEAEDAGADRS
jgi:hypothetical protein